MSKRFECEHNWIIDNNKRKTKESLIVYDEEWNTLDDLCELLNKQNERIAELEEQLKNATKQVRKEVCEEIRKWCDKNFNWVGDGTGYDGQDYSETIGSNNTINKLRELLDQIQGK